MLQPPKDVPDEVVRELEQLDNASLQASARFGMAAAIVMLAFFPILYWIGFRETWYLVAGPLICGVIIVAELAVAPRNIYWSGYIAIAGHLVMFGFFAWIVSPIIIGPGPAVITVMLLATHRRLIRLTLLALLTWFATLSPWLMQLAGVSAIRTTISGGDIIMHTASDHLATGPALVALALYIILLIHLAAFLAVFLVRLQDDERRRQRAKLQMQSWQLGQLVPRASSLPATD